jgi:hypothetical protein
MMQPVRLDVENRFAPLRATKVTFRIALLVRTAIGRLPVSNHAGAAAARHGDTGRCILQHVVPPVAAEAPA